MVLDRSKMESSPPVRLLHTYLDLHTALDSHIHRGWLSCLPPAQPVSESALASLSWSQYKYACLVRAK